MSSDPSFFRFADVTLDLRTGRVYRGSRALALEPRAFDVLVHLLRHAGEIVERDALIDLVWKDVHVTPHSVTQAVLQLRRAFDDNPSEPRVIETVHGRGYRFVAPVAHGPSPTRPNNDVEGSRFPAQVVSLIGRDALLANLSSRWTDTRCLSLVGPSGVGKTQLALEFARRIERDHDYGILVNLAPVEDGATVEREIALAFGVERGEGREFLSRLPIIVRNRRVLLVLDNCERVTVHCRRVVEGLMGTCPQLRILASSQQPLSARGETIVRVPPLDLPPTWPLMGRLATASLLESPAVDLFVRRALAVEPTFALTDENAPAVVEICRRLDGLPLAIELAAARIRVMSPQQIAERLEDRFRLLVQGHPTDPPRHEALSAALAWSFSLLSPGEQEFLTSLAVFMGGWTLDAVAAIARQPSGVLDLLQDLVDKSLVVADTRSAEARYRLLETVRLYALGRFNSSPFVEGVRARHFGFFSQMAEGLKIEMLGPNHAAAMAWFEREAGNLREALAWGLKTPEHTESALGLAVAMRWYWRGRGLFAEARDWLQRGIRAANSGSSRTLAQAHGALGMFAYYMGDFTGARASLLECLDRLGPDEPWERSLAFGILAFVEATGGDGQAANRLAADALALADGLDDDWLAGFALVASGVSIAVHSKAADAISTLKSGCARVMRSGEPFTLTYARSNLGLQCYLAGNSDDARRAFLDSLRGARELRNIRASAGCLEGLAYLAVSEGDLRWAARLMGAAKAMREVTGSSLLPHWRAAHECNASAIEMQLGLELTQRESEAGAHTSVEELIADLLSSEDSLRRQSGEPTSVT